MNKNPEERISEFMHRYGELKNELKVDMLAYPIYIPSKEGNTWETVIQYSPVDISKQPLKSPFNEPLQTS